MEIQRLHALLTDEDFNDLAKKHLPEGTVEEIDIHVQPDGVRVKGVYQMFMPVSFETLWEVGVTEGKVTARLKTFRTLGMPANLLKSLITNGIADAAKKEPWLRVDGDTIYADVDGLLKKNGVTIQTRLTAIRCESGQMIVEAGGNL